MDGVLTHHDTMSYLVRGRLLRNPLRLIPALPLVAAMTVLRRRPRAHGVTLRSLVTIGLTGMPADAYAILARATAQHLARGGTWALDDGIAAIRAHVAAGDEVTITTGCELALAVAFLEEFGLASVPIAASLYRPGRPYHHNFEAAKVTTLESMGVDLPNALFYTDSTADLPLARLVASTRLVNPDELTIRQFTDAGVEFETLRWQ